MATKKNNFDVKKIMIIGGIGTALLSLTGFVVASSKTITVYAELPKEVEKTKEDLGDIKDYVKQQRLSNELMQKMVEQKEKVFSPDGKSYWDEDEHKWKKVVK